MKFEKGKIFNANELVNYTEGGVVSKELIHNNAGSVTLFSSMLDRDFHNTLRPSMLLFK